MTDNLLDKVTSLEEDIALAAKRVNDLETHIASQDSEIYRLSKRMDQLVGAYQQLKEKLEIGAGNEAEQFGNFPADEKPPHY